MRTRDTLFQSPRLSSFIHNQSCLIKSIIDFLTQTRKRLSIMKAGANAKIDIKAGEILLEPEQKQERCAALESVAAGIMDEVQGSYLPRAGSHWGCQHSPAEMKHLSAARVTAHSYLIWLSYHLLRRCQPCSIYCSQPLSSARRSAAAFQCLSESNTKE